MDQVLLGAVSLGLLWSVMTLGVYITFRLLGMADMTVEGSLTLGAGLAARLIVLGVNPWLTLPLAVLAGALAGLCTGFLHTKLKIPPLLSGILTMIALVSVNLVVMARPNIALIRIPTVFTPLTNWGMKKDMSVLIVGAITAFAIVNFLYWFFGTELGSAIRATGSNSDLVRALGVHTDTTIILGLMLSNGLVALAGALIAQSQNYADTQMGVGAIVIGLASMIIGEVLFGKRNYYVRFMAIILGAVAYRIMIALVLQMGMPADYLKLFTALTVVTALCLPRAQSGVKTFVSRLKLKGVA